MLPSAKTYGAAPQRPSAARPHKLLRTLVRFTLFVLAGVYPVSSRCQEKPTLFYPAQWYDGSPDSIGATPIALSPGGTSPPLHFSIDPSGGALAVRVVSEIERVPVEGILIEALAGRFSALARTGVDGRASIAGIPAGPTLLRTRPDDPRSETGAYAVRFAPGVADSSAATVFHVTDGVTSDAGEIMVPGAARVKARVVHPSGGGWAEIPVVLRSAGGSYRRAIRTNDQGDASFGGLEPGSYRLWADARGTDAITESWDGSRDTLAAASLSLTADTVASGLVITPDRGGEIRGAIRELDTNAGIPGIDVRVFRASNPTEAFTFLTDEIGFYHARGLPTGLYKIYIPAIRRYYVNAETEAAARGVSVVEGGSLDGIDMRGRTEADCAISPETAGTVEGIVRADFTRLAEARVVLWNDSDTLGVTVTSDGLYRIGCITPGPYRAALVPEGVYRKQFHPKVYDPDSATIITVTAGDTTKQIDFQPDLGVVLEGWVASAADGIGVPDIPVIAMLRGDQVRATGQTDDAGSFRIERLGDGTGLPAGEWVVATDSMTIPRVSLTPAVSVGLMAVRIGAGVLLTFRFPSDFTITGWRLERSEAGGPPVGVTDATAHPDGLGARDYLDRVPPGFHRYRLVMETVLDGHGPAEFRSDWILPDGSTVRPRGVVPSPWDGEGEIVLPGPVASGTKVEVVAANGRRILRLEARGDRTSFEGGDLPAAGVYFLSWKDPSGRHRAARLVLQR